MGFNIFFIISAFSNPVISDGQIHGGIGIGQNGNPFIGMDGGPIVQVRADINILDAQLSKPVAKLADVCRPKPQGVVSGSHPRIAAFRYFRQYPERYWTDRPLLPTGSSPRHVWHPSTSLPSYPGCGSARYSRPSIDIRRGCSRGRHGLLWFRHGHRPVKE